MIETSWQNKMPKAKQKSGRQPEPELVQNSDDESNSNHGASMTQAERVVSAMSADEINKRVNDLVQYLLIMDHKKLPIKRQDINKHVLRDCARSFPIIVNRAKDKLSSVFGIDLVELDSKSKSYILVSQLENEVENPHQVWGDEENQKTGLIMIILSLIFMNDNVMSDSLLYHTLKKLGVDVERVHDVFGEVKKLITQEFVRQGYLEYIKQSTGDPPQYEFRWGQRAKSETTKRDVLNFVCQIYRTHPNQWTSQWQDVQRSDGNIENGEGPSHMD